MGFWQRVLQGAFLVLGGWLSLLLAGFFAGIFVGSFTALVTYFLLSVLIAGGGHSTGICLVGAALAGLVAFSKTFFWFATLGGLLRHR